MAEDLDRPAEKAAAATVKTPRVAGPVYAILLTFLLGLSAVRFARILSSPPRLDGHREESLPWAYRDRSLGGLLRVVGSSLRFGELLWVTVPASGSQYEPSWFRVMANYAWPYQSVLGVSAGPPKKGFRRTVVVFEASGSVRILRPGSPEVDLP